jgi:hypothetical protein
MGEATAQARVSRLLCLPGGRFVCRLVCDADAQACRLVATALDPPEGGGAAPARSYRTALPRAFAGACMLRRGCGTGLSRLHALALCPTGVALQALPSEEELGGADEGARLLLRSAVVGPSLLAYGAQAAVDARWHPWSGRHFVTLSEDGLRTWDAAAALGDAGAAAGPGRALCAGAGQRGAARAAGAGGLALTAFR